MIMTINRHFEIVLNLVISIKRPDNFQNKSMPVAFLSSVDSFDALDQNLMSLEDFNIPGGDEYLVQ